MRSLSSWACSSRRRASKTREKGTRAHAAWFAAARRDAKLRGESEAARVALTDEEVLEALRELGPDPVPGGLVRSIAPGELTMSELAWIGQSLVRLHKDGLATREEVDRKLRSAATPA